MSEFGLVLTCGGSPRALMGNRAKADLEGDGVDPS